MGPLPNKREGQKNTNKQSPFIRAQIRFVEAKIPRKILISQRILVTESQVVQYVLAIGEMLGMLSPGVQTASQLPRRLVDPQLLRFAVEKGEAGGVVVPLVAAMTPRKRIFEGGDEEEEGEG